MGDNANLVPRIKDNNWTSVRQAISKLASSALGPTSSPTFAGMTLTTLTVGNISISGASITSDTGAISFGDEDLTTTGNLVVTGSGVATFGSSGQAEIDAQGGFTTLSDIICRTLAVQPVAAGNRFKFLNAGGFLGLKSLDSTMVLRMYPSVTDGSGNCNLNIYGLGDSADNSHFERLNTGWSVAAGKFVINVNIKGNGATKELDIYAHGHAGQLLLKTNGDVDFGTGNINVSSNNKFISLGVAASDLKIYSDGANGVIDVATALRLGNDVTNYTEIGPTGILKPVGSAYIYNTDNIKTYYGTGGGATGDVSTYFDGEDWIFNSENATANDEIHFTNFDKYTFDNVVSGIYPTASAHFATKEYVDIAVAGIEFDMFLDDLDSTINDPGTANDYYSLQTTETGSATTTRDAYAALGQGDDLEVVSYISGAALPFAELQIGVIDFHVHARKNGSGQKIATIFGKLYHRASGGTETLIATTEESAALGIVVSDYDLHGNIASVVSFSATDRLVLKVRANVQAAGGANAQIEITQEGSEDSRVSALVVTDTLSEIFLRQDGTKPLTGAWDMGSQNLTNVNIDSGTITGITDLAIADGGTGQGTAQLAINALSAVGAATNEHVLTKDTGTGNAIWKAAAGGGGFVDRGDPAAYDFTVGDFTTDGAWHDLDLSSIVTNSDAKAILLNLVIQDGVAASRIRFRKNGNSNERAITGIETQAANITMRGAITIPCDVNQVVEYQGDNLVFTAINLTVLGWFL